MRCAVAPLRAGNSIRALSMVKPYLKYGVFTELKDLNYFKKVKLAFGTIQWPNEQDIAPDTLFLEGTLLDSANQHRQ